MKDDECNLIILAAADLIEQQGWTQSQMKAYAPTGEIIGYCLLGAIKQVAPNRFQLRARIYDHIREETGRNPVQFNDATGRTKEEVIALLRRIAE